MSNPLNDLLDYLDPPGAVPSVKLAQRHVRRLARAANRTHDWTRFPPRVQVALASYWVSRKRYLASQHTVDPYLRSMLDQGMNKVRDFIDTERPGRVLPLQSGRPARGNWLAESQYWWDQLTRPGNGARRVDPSVALRGLSMALADSPTRASVQEAIRVCRMAGIQASDPRLVQPLVPFPELLKGVPDLKSTRAAVERLIAVDTESALREPRLSLPADWPWYWFTRGKHAGVVGGHPSTEVAQRYLDAFDFSQVNWVAGGPRRVESLCQRIEQRHFDLVIVVQRYIGHAESGKTTAACRSAGVPAVLVMSGYGPAQVRAACEAQAKPKEPEPSDPSQGSDP